MSDMQKLKFRTDFVKPIWEPAFVQEIQKALGLRHALGMKSEEFLVEASHNTDQVQVRVTLQSRDGTLVYPVEAVALKSPQQKESPLEIAELLLDCVDVYWGEYFQGDRDVYVTMDWGRHTCEGVVFYMRGAVRHARLEDAANDLLRTHGHGEQTIIPFEDEIT